MKIYYIYIQLLFFRSIFRLSKRLPNNDTKLQLFYYLKDKLVILRKQLGEII